MADLVIWQPAFFGVKPQLIIKGGFIVWAAMGDANASIPTPQPVLGRPMFGAFGRAPYTCSVSFLSLAGVENNISDHLKLQKRILPVSNCRNINKESMIHNAYTPQVTVNPETYEVRADGEHLVCAPAEVLPMAQRYFLF